LKLTEKLTEGSTVAKKHIEARFEDAIEYSLLQEGSLSKGRRPRPWRYRRGTGRW
jgi:hypothetical protein